MDASISAASVESKGFGALTFGVCTGSVFDFDEKLGLHSCGFLGLALAQSAKKANVRTC